MVADDADAAVGPLFGEFGEGGGDEGVGGDVQDGVAFDAGFGGGGGLVVDVVAEAEPAEDGEQGEYYAYGDHDDAGADSSSSAAAMSPAHVVSASFRSSIRWSSLVRGRM
ncbi:hypothetical protein [Rhodococcus sp. PD04]|uniref:hypothetical protein n=1 Tax=Rhodococcus sp. PD04 TaxID=3109594 RepID=UPI002DD8EAA3|nr:hypothetical protein [Rhodococcus sp. PD04]WSE20695.1 hypothetical protein U9J23_13245 [Rhodococcus sp. PD04]